ncbi:TRAP transporter small permease [Allobaculum mucilyticum]|uniref:TRAP transporter small permease n=1 Tax=Allobaculum mucilyticum TaxID=2834459 RepID=UPI001E42FE44|nr:TRAP transporter small permease [Allobaculum mucilyticum]UNT96190.1 TRAP transporter small permease [Allobaculum mucilyticum]
MEKFKKLLNLILGILAGGSFLIMVALVVYQVITRYVFNNPSSWSEELVSYMFAWTSLFGACLVTGNRGHMNIPLLVEKVKPSARKALNIFSEVIILLFSVIILIWGGYKVSELAMGQMTSSLGCPVGVFYFALPVAGILMTIYAVINIIELIRGINPETDAAEAADKEAA